MTEFTAIQRDPSLVARVTEQLLSSIGNGALGPGQALPSERELAEQFGVSRTVIREAVRALHARGVVEVRSGRGARISAVSSRHVSDAIGLYVQGAKAQNVIQPWHISEVRETLELRLAELAATRISDNEIQQMEAELDAMTNASTAHDAAAHDAAFHRLIAQATHNPLFVTLLESIAAAILPIRESSLTIEGRVQIAYDQHAAILAGLKHGNAEEAAAAMRSHLEDSRHYYHTDTADSGEVTAYEPELESGQVVSE